MLRAVAPLPVGTRTAAGSTCPRLASTPAATRWAGRIRPARSTPLNSSRTVCAGRWASVVAAIRAGENQYCRSSGLPALNRAVSVPAVAPILDGGPRPAWLGPPVASRPARQLPDAPPFPEGALGVALYPVCFDAGDARCAEAAR